MKKINMISVILSVMLWYSCATSAYITSAWKAPDVTPKQFNKLIVVGIIRAADRTLREQMEEHMAGDLKDLGYNAFSAYKEYGPKVFENMNETQANEKLAKDSIDAVITIVLLDKQKERYYVPGRVIYTPYGTYYNHFWGYYRSIYTRIQSPGYFEESTRYFWESNFYDLKNNQLLYSVQTQSFEPASTADLAHRYGQMIVQRMLKDNVLQKQEAKLVKSM